jgi:hypothetical protein
MQPDPRAGGLRDNGPAGKAKGKEDGMKRLLVVTTVAFLVVGVTTALAALSTNTIGSTATVAKKGRQVKVTVQLGCDRLQDSRVRITVTQPDGALAQKGKKLRCTTDTGNFPLKAKARGRHRFVPGAATVCAVAITSDSARQWCKEVTLVTGSKK